MYPCKRTCGGRQSDLYGLLNALGGARRLRVLDVGGNLAGDAGARLLAKALQCNCTLHTLYIDRNAFSLQGTYTYSIRARRVAKSSNLIARQTSLFGWTFH